MLHCVQQLVIEPLNGESTCEYCARMRRSGQWGTAAEILALTRVLHRPIIVYTLRSGKFNILEQYGRSAVKDSCMSRTELCVLYVRSTHYMALLPHMMSSAPASLTPLSEPTVDFGTKKTSVGVTSEREDDPVQELLDDFLSSYPPKRAKL